MLLKAPFTIFLKRSNNLRFRNFLRVLKTNRYLYINNEKSKRKKKRFLLTHPQLQIPHTKSRKTADN